MLPMKIKIVQIENFYSAFLELHYQRYVGLSERPFREQISSLLESGFSGGHNVVPYLDPSRWASYYIVANNVLSQRRWLLEQDIYSTNISLSQVLEMQLQQIKPDVVYLSDVLGCDLWIFDRLNPKPLVVGWLATVVDDRVPWDKIDLLLSGIDAIRQWASERGVGATANYMPAAFSYANPWYQVGTPSYDVVFSGSFSELIHAERINDLRRLAKSLDNCPLHIFTPTPFNISVGEAVLFHPPVFGCEVINLYSHAKIVIDSRDDFGLGEEIGSHETSNMMIFEATRAGSLLITEDCTNLGQYFNVGQEIEVYRSTEELIDKVRYYMAPENIQARERIAAAGQARVAAEHLIEHRARWFDRLVSETLHQNNIFARTTNTPTNLHLVTTIANAQSVVFSIALTLHLAQQFSPLEIFVICQDEVAKNYLSAINIPARLISLKEVERWELTRFSGDTKPPIALAPARWLRFMVNYNPGIARVTYIDPSLSLDVLDVIYFQPDDHQTWVLSYNLGSHFQYEAECCGDISLEYFSIFVDNHSSALLDELLDGIVDKSNASWHIQKVFANWNRSNFALQKFVAKGAWNFDALDPSATNTIRYFHLLNRQQNGIWTFLPLDEVSGWPICYEQSYSPYMMAVEQIIHQYPILLELGDQIMPSAESKLSGLLLRHVTLQQQGFRLLTRAEFDSWSDISSGLAGTKDNTTTADTIGWDSPEVAAAQHQAFQYLVYQYRQGNQRTDLEVLADILSLLLKPGGSLLETDCGSGYNGAFIKEFVQPDYRYTGIDLAPAMIQLACATYPEDSFAVMSASALDYPDNSFDVVVSGASLMHTVQYEKALDEAARVATRFVLLHTVTIAAGGNAWFEKIAYGVRVPEVCFGEVELATLLAERQLEPILMKKSIDYNLMGILGRPTQSVSITCRSRKTQVTNGHDPNNFNYYCTYFDANYLPRGIVMMRSLLRHDPKAHLFVLCLDQVTMDTLQGWSQRVMPIAMTELMAADPVFACSRDDRSQIEWYFTSTSCFVQFLFEHFPRLPRITYLDADLYFYASPEIIHYEAEGASVQIIEHRFSSRLASLITYGRFNVGWISFFNTLEGRQVVADYRRDCLEWCHDWVDGERFADQKYLDRWPSLYPQCCISRLWGANVAPWNLSRWEPSLFAGNLFLDGHRLIFYHFHGIRRSITGDYTPLTGPDSLGWSYPFLYKPYFKELLDLEVAMAEILQDVDRKNIRYYDQELNSYSNNEEKATAKIF